jgi:hypothetical protein
MKPNTDLHHRESAALAPITQALITGMITAAVLGWVVLSLRIMDPLQWIAGGFILGVAGYWGLLQRQWLHLTRRDNPSYVNTVSAPSENIPALEVWIHKQRVNGIGQSEKVSFGASPQTMVILAKGLLAGRPFTRAAWVSSGILTDDQHRMITKEMLDRGLLRYKVANNPRNGTELTPEGAQVMQSIIDISPTGDA